MPVNTSSPNKKDSKERTVSNACKEEQCTLYIWDNYLVQSFRYEMGVYNQLQGTRIVLNKGSRSSRYSELEDGKHSLSCQIYNEMRQNTICEFCTRPRVLCSCVRLDSSLGTFSGCMNFQEDPCHFCEHLLRDCECEDLLNLSKSIVEDDNAALVYLLQKERGTQVSGRLTNRGMKETGITTCKVPIKYNPLTAEKTVRCCKNHKTPLFKYGDMKVAYYGRENTKKESGRCRHCATCARPLSRCVCDKLEVLRQKKEKSDCARRMSFQSEGGKFVYFPKKNHAMSTKGTRGRIDPKRDRLTEIVEKLCRSKSRHREKYEISNSSHCCDISRAIAKHPDFESTFAETDGGYLSAEKETDMDNYFPEEEVANCEEKRIISKTTAQQMELSEVVVSNAPLTPSSNQKEIIKATEEVTREEFTIKKALNDLNITVTISKQTEETTPLFDFEKSQITYDSKENCEKTKALEGGHNDVRLKPCATDERSQLLPRFMITGENTLMTNSVTEMKDKYSCRRISSKRYVMGKVFMQSMEEKQLVEKTPRSVERTNKTDLAISSGVGFDLGEKYSGTKNHTSKEIEIDSSQRNDEFDFPIVQKLERSREEVCVSTNSPSRKFIGDNIETSTQYMENIMNEKSMATLGKEVEVTNQILKIDQYTCNETVDFINTTKETQYEETLIYTKSKYSSINGIEVTDESTELEFFMSQETINRHLRLPCCITENSVKFPPSNITTQNFFDKTFNTIKDNQTTVSAEKDQPTQHLSTKSETCVEINQSIKSQITFSEERNRNEVNGNPSIKNSRNIIYNRKRRSEGNVQFKSESRQTQTGGTFEQDVIASIVAGFEINPKNSTSSEAIRNLFNRFCGYNLHKKMSPKSVVNISKSSRNSIVALCLNPIDYIKSIQIQAGSNYSTKSADTQTAGTFEITESQDLSESSAAQLFRKKFDYICGPEGPEFKTKISMNLHKLLQVNNTIAASVQSDQSDDYDDTGDESERGETSKKVLMSGSTDLPEVRDASTKAWSEPCYSIGDSEEELQNMRKYECWQNQEEEIAYQDLSHRPKFENQNTFAAYYSSHSTFVHNNRLETFHDGIQPILNPRKIVTSEHDMYGHVSQNIEMSSVRIIGENENKKGGSMTNSPGGTSSEDVVHPDLKAETGLDQIDFLALERAVNTFIKLKNYFVEDTK
ncbi:hypothetical protein WA026_011005 [Henosepilachna vigintioctopunctata]|uniref:Uncharacterized protein n=1 Tax=Henosepilachna vigintioctopunctata TaxID=420089 RepID=A0AAW1UZT3_9CUCU